MITAKKTDRRATEKFSEFQSEHSLAAELPYWDFLDRIIVLADGSLATGLRLRGLSLETLDTERVNQMAIEWRSILNSLPDGMELGFLSEINSDWESTIASHESERSADLKPDVAWISQSRIDHLRDLAKAEALLKTNLTVFIFRRFAGENGSANQPFWKSFFSPPRWFSEVKKKDHELAVRELEQTTEALKVRFESCGVRATDLAPTEICQGIYRALNPSRSKQEPTPTPMTDHRTQTFLPEELEKSPGLTISSAREQMIFSSLIQGYDSFYLDGYHYRMISFKTLPEFTNASLIAKLQALPFANRLYVHVKVPEQSKELSDLQAKRRMAHSMSLSHGGRATDLESESKLQATEELLRELINTGQKIFYFQATVTISAPDHDELNLRTKAVLSRIRELNGAEGMNETVATYKVWKTTLPFGNTAMVRPKRVKTDNLADLIPLYQPYEGPKAENSRPVCLFQNRSLGLVSYDPFDQNNLPNFNSLVTGSSGAGKSFLNNLILLQYVTKKPLIYIIDVGGSYKKLCEFLGGQYIEVSPPRHGEEYRPINPMDLPVGATEPSPQKLKFLLALLEGVLTDEEGDKLRKLDKSLLEEAIIQTYSTVRAQKNRVPRLSDLADHLSHSKESALKDFSKMLYPWTGDRPYGRLLDADNALDLKSDVVVFDLKGLSSYPDLQSVMILIITDFILGRIESRGGSDAGRRKQILMDEAWELLKTKAASSFMEYCVRTLRKTGSGITFITQGLEEIVASPIGAALLSNTATKFILLQRGDLDPIRKILKFNDQEMSLIASLGQAKGRYSEAFLMANEDRAVIRVCPTPIEYWLATSDPADNALLEQCRLENPNKTLAEHIYDLASRYPFGAASGVINEKKAA